MGTFVVTMTLGLVEFVWENDSEKLDVFNRLDAEPTSRVAGSPGCPDVVSVSRR